MTTSNKKKLVFEGISHLEDLKLEKLVSFIKNWTSNPQEFTATEKVDGNFMAFGIKNGKFYLRSKNKQFFTIMDIPKVHYMGEFKRYFDEIRNIPLFQILIKVLNQHDIVFDGDFEVFGEAIPSPQHNIVQYDKEIIGNGIFVIFGTKNTFGKDRDGLVEEHSLWKKLAEHFNKHTTIKFIPVPKVSYEHFTLDSSAVDKIKEIYQNEYEFLKKPARTPEAKTKKSNLLQQIRDNAAIIKNQFLDHEPGGSLGAETEGFVLRTPDGDNIKIVDKNKFTERKETNWQFINRFLNAEKLFKKALSENQNLFSHALEDWEDAVSLIKNELDSGGYEQINIATKLDDTKHALSRSTWIIKNLKRLSEEQELSSVVELFLSGKLEELLLQKDQFFEMVNSFVPKELLDVNFNKLKNIFSDAETEKDIMVVGNKNKKMFGDVDIAIEKEYLKNFLGVTERTFWAKLESYLLKGSLPFHINKGLNQFHLIFPLFGKGGEHSNAYEQNGSVKKDLGFIQIDFFVGSMNWMKKYLSGAPPESNYKAAHRNILFASIFSKLVFQPFPNVNRFVRYVLDPKNGIRRQYFEMKPPQGRQRKFQKVLIREEHVSSDVMSLYTKLFHNSSKESELKKCWDSINTVEKLLYLLKSDKFKYKELLPAILEDFKNSLQRSNLSMD